MSNLEDDNEDQARDVSRGEAMAPGDEHSREAGQGLPAMSQATDYHRWKALKSAYGEACTLYRHFSSSRAKLFAGYLITMAGVTVAYGWSWTHVLSKPLAWAALAAGCLLTTVFWALERRSRQISLACILAASELEREMALHPEQGALTRIGQLPEVEPAHSRTMDWMYFAAALGLLVGTVYSLAETM